MKVEGALKATAGYGLRRTGASNPLIFEGLKKRQDAAADSDGVGEISHHMLFSSHPDHARVSSGCGDH